MLAASVQFTEVLRGWMRAAGDAGAARWPAAARLTVTLDDVEGFLRGARRARAEGWVEPPALGGRRPMTAGTVDFFVPVPPAAPTGRTTRLGLLYTLPFTSACGTPYILHGVKRLTGGAPCRIWPETTALDVRVVAATEQAAALTAPEEPAPDGQITDGPVTDGPVTDGPVTDPDGVVAEGELRIGPAAFLRQLTTFRGTGPGAGRAAGAFVLDFAAHLARLYTVPRPPSSRGRSARPSRSG
ncbi:hypothetical protein [Streptomyces sp. AC627_RSS907]|uniref:hypothetical protein n=1 Tax=Streptomyces sp. AC627_RSS907 TaxID=2823684 RepID=UPI001C24DC8A|nr:hypothetical protein [Streptomyces sp. AC627_RSS907]